MISILPVNGKSPGESIKGKGKGKQAGFHNLLLSILLNHNVQGNKFTLLKCHQPSDKQLTHTNFKDKTGTLTKREAKGKGSILTSKEINPNMRSGKECPFNKENGLLTEAPFSSSSKFMKPNYKSNLSNIKRGVGKENQRELINVQGQKFDSHRPKPDFKIPEKETKLLFSKKQKRESLSSVSRQEHTKTQKFPTNNKNGSKISDKETEFFFTKKQKETAHKHPTEKNQGFISNTIKQVEDKKVTINPNKQKRESLSVLKLSDSKKQQLQPAKPNKEVLKTKLRKLQEKKILNNGKAKLSQTKQMSEKISRNNFSNNHSTQTILERETSKAGSFAHESKTVHYNIDSFAANSLPGTDSSAKIHSSNSSLHNENSHDGRNFNHQPDKGNFEFNLKLDQFSLSAKVKSTFINLSLDLPQITLNSIRLGEEIKAILIESGFERFKIKLRSKGKTVYSQAFKREKDRLDVRV